MYAPDFDSSSQKYLIFSSVPKMQFSKFEININRPGVTPQNTNYTLGVQFKSKRKSVSQFFPAGTEDKSFTLNDLTFSGVASTQPKKISFIMVGGFKVTNEEDNSQEKEYWTSKPKPYTFFQLAKYSTYTISFERFKKGDSVDYAKVKDFSSPEMAINTKVNSIGRAFSSYTDGGSVSFSPSTSFSSKGIYLVKNNKIIAQVKTPDPESIDWNDFRETAGVDTIIKGKRSSYLGSKDNVSINDILDKNKPISYLYRGQNIPLDRGLLKQHKSARKFLEKFDSVFLLEDLEILSSKN